MRPVANEPASSFIGGFSVSGVMNSVASIASSMSQSFVQKGLQASFPLNVTHSFGGSKSASSVENSDDNKLVVSQSDFDFEDLEMQSLKASV